MIITQEQALLKAQGQFQILLDFVARASAEQQRLDQTERGLLSGLLAVGRSLLTAFVAGAGDGDRGETATATDGSVQRRLPEQHSRTYRSIFGTLSITQHVYGTRASAPRAAGCQGPARGGSFVRPRGLVAAFRRQSLRRRI